jgi:hypothetical protein
MRPRAGRQAVNAWFRGARRLGSQSELLRRCAFLLVICVQVSATGQPTRTETFDAEPAWTGVNNQPRFPPCITVDQDFGYSPRTTFAGGAPGEIGGKIWRASSIAYYARVIAPKTFEDKLSASGRFAVTKALGSSGFIFGWFNSTSPPGWRNLNSLALRVDGERGFYRVYCEYGTRLKRTSTITINRRQNTQHLDDGTVHSWSLAYDPAGNRGGGSIHFKLDADRWTLNLEPGHKLDGAVFDRFGLWNRQTEPGAPMWVYLNDVVLEGVPQDFSADPGWVGIGNHRTYTDCEVEPRHNFGFRKSNYAGGAAAGEMGGILWRTESEAPQTAGYYADTRIGTLSLTNKLSARGKLAMPRTCVDAGLYLGWFNAAFYSSGSSGDAKEARSQKSEVREGRGEASPVRALVGRSRTGNILAPRNFVGAVVESPSDEGQKINACYRTGTGTYDLQPHSPRVVPPTGPLEWSIDYDPSLPKDNLVVTVAGQQSVLTVPEAVRIQRTIFNAFGIGTTRKGGHWIEMFFDDITYTVAAGIQ